MKRLLIVSGLALATSALAAPFERVSPKTTEKVELVLKKAEDKFLDQATFAGIHTAVRYMLEAYPERGGAGFQSRIDSYELGMKNGKISGLMQTLEKPIGFKHQNGMRLLFARQFSDSREARGARPYGVAEMPITAEIAREKLVPGDFATFTNRMNVMLSAGLSLGIFGPLKLGDVERIGVSGEFLVQVYRLKGDRARVRLLAVQGNSSGRTFGLSVGVPLTLIGINALGPIDEFSLVSIKATTVNQRGVFSLLDYVFNLRDPAAADAYDKLMSGNVRLAKIKAPSPIKNKRLNEIYFSDATETEALAAADLSRMEGERRVERIDQVRASFKGHSRGMKISIGLLSVNRGTTTTSNKVIRENSAGAAEHFVFNTYTPATYVKLLFGLIKEDHLYSMRTLLGTDSQFRPLGFRALSFVNERRVGTLKDRHIERLRDDLSGLLPPDSLKGLELERTGEKSPKNGFLRSEFTFNEAAFRHFRKPDPRALSPRLRRYFAGKDLSAMAPVYAPNSSGELNAIVKCSELECFDRDFEEMSPLISVVADKGASVRRREEALRKLMRFPLFRRYGGSIMMGLLPTAGRSALVRASVLVTASGARPFLLNQGEDPDGLLASLEEVHEEIYGKPFANPFK